MRTKMMIIVTLLTLSVTTQAEYRFDCISEGGKKIVISNFGYGKYSVTVDGEVKNAGFSRSSTVYKKYGSDVYSFPGGNFDVIDIYAGYGEFLGQGLMRTASVRSGLNVRPMKCTVTDLASKSSSY